MIPTAKLIAITAPQIKDQNGNPLSAEDFLVYTARVSSPHNQLNLDTGGKLLSYCIKNKHWSIFEQATATMEIETNVAIATQILRHRSFTFSQLSRRYSSDKMGFDKSLEARRQDTKNRQNSTDDLPPDVKQKFIDKLQEIEKLSETAYNWGLESGIAKECARFLLPQSLMTTMYMTGNVRSWIHYFELRCALSTQKEHRAVAVMMRDELSKYFPIISKELGWTTNETTT